MNQKKMILLECLFLTMAPVETLQWQLGSQDMVTPMIIELPHCAGAGEASSANHNVPPGGEGTSGGNSGWTSILGSSSGESSEASVNQPTGSSNQKQGWPVVCYPRSKCQSN
jgi:hypothetical protein